ncbi:MAG: adenosylmethionine--8-amino-7-oxononanoate transaminase [Burkholderiaceae bacterium]|nr:MAG: adenosylmethionine--8-amino-7-oxononanoate transaminase [Burkholderiaceae bacterium]
MNPVKSVAELDHAHVWHPFTQAHTAPAPLPIVRGAGAYLYDEQGKAYCDLISSWWVNLHGHAHPAIAEAIAAQARTLEHVLFAGFTHAPAAELAQALTAALPAPLERVFFSDNGSTATEIALKMSYQYWYNRSEKQRTLFLAFDGAYHGDTFGAMAAGRTSSFFNPFQPFLFETRTLPWPHTWIGDHDIETREAQALLTLDTVLQQDGHRIAALIVEPLIQGASGMRCVRPQFMRAVIERVRAMNILVIFDEVMTGFGRTGKMFACEHIGITPDLICLSKGLTGGFLPMAVTVATDAIYQAFLGEHFSSAFAHGHSYTANPLGCAAALASLHLFNEEGSLQKIAALEHVHRDALQKLAQHPRVNCPRVLGSIAAFNLDAAHAPYDASLGRQVQQHCLDAGLIVRPLGNTVYLLPPYCLTPEQLQDTYDTLTKILDRCLDSKGSTPVSTGF